MEKSTFSTPVKFERIDNDFLDVLQYTLPNGLKLFLSVNKDEPRVFTNIVMRAGSKQDPPDTTGLAHYMEHMLFKGTSKIGTLDWEKEKVLLQKISDLYEQHRQTQDKDIKKAIYKEIDQLSNDAAKLVAANEYDKLATAIGAQKTNAYTWVEQTVYVNEIPSNEIERWMELESERFRMLALRLFHTEMETVYEEFNMIQDNDYRKANKAIMQQLFPQHPYGTQTTIGTAEDLKNPSHENIQWYFNTYYVPNNMAIVMAGDFDPEQVVQWAEKYFGQYQPKELPSFTFEEQPELKEPLQLEVKGEEAAFVQIGWRMDAARTDETIVLSLIANILYNDKAGLIDINLNQPQKLLQAVAYHFLYEDYSTLMLYGRPRTGQTLEEAEELLLEQVEKLKKGEFEDWLIEAVINDLQLERLSIAENNQSRVGILTSTYILGISWQEYLQRAERLKSITKQDVVDYANKFLKNNYVSVYKRQKKDDSVVKVEKPEITTVPLDRNQNSDFAKSFLLKSSPALQPEFVNYQEAIERVDLKEGIDLYYVENPHNDTFRLEYIFEMGKFHDKRLPLIMNYLPYLGTSKYTPTQIQQELYRLGLSLDVYAGKYRSYVMLSGLGKSLEKGVQLLEHVFEAAEPNQTTLNNVVDDILAKRENAKKDKDYLSRQALFNYGLYGEQSPISYRLKSEEMKNISAADLVKEIKQLFQFPHSIYYYGQTNQQKLVKLLNSKHRVLTPQLSVPAPTILKAADSEEHQVFVLDFPIVQTDILMVSKGTAAFSMEEYLFGEIYNEYFGYGLSSVVFQEIRESRALAYSTYAFYGSPARQDHAHYLRAYVGTQPDKMAIAIDAMREIVQNMPVAEDQIEQARQSILKKIESERITPARRFWEHLKWSDRGVEEDARKLLYDFAQRVTAQDLIDFQAQKVKDRKFNFMIMGNKEHIDTDYLKKIGPVKEIGIKDIFGEV